nr:hypothetical protein [Tanacetum cinerariifolium]
MLPSPSNDPLPCGEDSLKLKELMDLCTYFSNNVLELESKVIDIKSTYKERIKKLEGRVENVRGGEQEVQSKEKGKGILIEEPKSLKGQAQIKQDEAFARQLEAELNAYIN